MVVESDFDGMICFERVTDGGSGETAWPTRPRRREAFKGLVVGAIAGELGAYL